ncbi:MAG: lamin tail domain-containing protein, partial [Bacteroidales bacterium]|nr:lamin tail domain-containing protein [Bacteroidales bacterium]
MNRLVPHIIYLVINCFIIIQLQGQVVINEICSRNAVTMKDNYNDYPDWIELYNKGTDIIELKNWTLTDNITEPEKWIFPDIVIYPDSYLVVFASDKNDKTIVDH